MKLLLNTIYGINATRNVTGNILRADTGRGSTFTTCFILGSLGSLTDGHFFGTAQPKGAFWSNTALHCSLRRSQSFAMTQLTCVNERFVAEARLLAVWRLSCRGANRFLCRQSPKTTPKKFNFLRSYTVRRALKLRTLFLVTMPMVLAEKTPVNKIGQMQRVLVPLYKPTEVSPEGFRTTRLCRGPPT